MFGTEGSHGAQVSNQAPLLGDVVFDGGAGIFGEFSGNARPPGRAGRRVQERTAERDQIVREIGELEKEIEFVQTDEYVERAARDELGLIMPGEVRYVNAAGEGE